MAQFAEAEARLFGSMYVCRKCESRQRVPINKILAGKGVCRKCSAKQLRPVRRVSKK